MLCVGLVQTSIRDVEGVRILHHKFASAEHACAWAFLIAVLGLDLVQGDWEVLVGVVQILHRGGEHFLVGWSEQVVGTLAVLQTEQRIAVFCPTLCGFIRLTWQECWEEQLLSSDRIHFLAYDSFNVAHCAQTQWQPGVDTWGNSADISCTDKQLVAWNFCICRVFAQGAQKQRGKTCDHR